ncbi:hypothetical protein [Lacticaseibacillus paracasei]|uniref:hypothetical protein n=1 Tax=Lacticaseibacillus paracasei TaxID=1597 RepID=UPI000297FD85|nr:hypothetical protein [Lacticaseibacillus paracasei]EKQ09050.1 hypothetical protein LCAA2362_0948 [Lacticaseibacillus casei A2-362]MCT4383938.1 hypothetical protein [Lacticaseibacillus paracasei]
MAKTDEELAVDLTVAMLNHNAQLHEFSATQGTVGRSTSPFMKADYVASQYAYLLATIQGKIDPLHRKSNHKSE